MSLGNEGAITDCPATRGPVGGPATVFFGTEDAAERFVQEQRYAAVDTPDALPRFPQAPGGSSSFQFGGEGVATEFQAMSGPVGGATTIVLGGDDPKEACGLHQQRYAAVANTPDAASRFPQAPGGFSSIQLGGEGAAAELQATSGPVGGATTIVLGVDDPRDALLQRQRQREVVVDTPDALLRFPQAPGGSSSMCFSGGTADVPATTRPVGGPATVLLGGEDSAERFVQQQQRYAAVTDTPDAAARFPQAPGGSSSIQLGGENDLSETLQLLAQRRGQRQAPGGTSTFVLGGDCNDPLSTHFENTSSNKFANAASQNCGNVLTERPSVRLRQAPGGTSTLVLGGHCNDPVVEKVSSTRVRQAPGGTSSISFGDCDKSVKVPQAKDENVGEENILAAPVLG